MYLYGLTRLISIHTFIHMNYPTYVLYISLLHLCSLCILLLSVNMQII